MMAASSFAGTFTETVLTYTIDSSVLVTDEYGNEIPTPGTPQTVKAFLRTPRAPDVRAQIGADVVLVSYEGRLTDPAQPPVGFVTGTRVSFLMDGQTVEGRVKVFAPSPIPGLDDELGRQLQVAANG